MLLLPRTNPKGDGLDDLRRQYASHRTAVVRNLISTGRITRDQVPEAERSFDGMVEEYLDINEFPRTPELWAAGAHFVSWVLTHRSSTQGG